MAQNSRCLIFLHFQFCLFEAQVTICRRLRPMFSATSAAPAAFASRNFAVGNAVLHVFCTFGVNLKALSVKHVNVRLFPFEKTLPVHATPCEGRRRCAAGRAADTLSIIHRAPSSVLNSELQSSKLTISSTAQTQILNAKIFHERFSVAFHVL